MNQPGPRLAWGRYTAEAATIVVGILLALAADAAWGYRTDRALEREILAALRIEFTRDQQEIEDDLRARETKIYYLDRLSAYRSGSGAPLPLDSVPDALRNLTRFRFYTPSHPVLDETIAAGRLDLIRSDSLRRALMLFQAERERIRVVEEQEQDVVWSQVAPYFADRLDLDLLMSGGPLARSAAEAFVAATDDPVFGSMLYLNRRRAESSQNYTARLRTAVDAVLGSLETD